MLEEKQWQDYIKNSEMFLDWVSESIIFNIIASHEWMWKHIQGPRVQS